MTSWADEEDIVAEVDDKLKLDKTEKSVIEKKLLNPDCLDIRSPSLKKLFLDICSLADSFHSTPYNFQLLRCFQNVFSLINSHKHKNNI